jgi:methionine--tRNA ligase beta chain
MAAAVAPAPVLDDEHDHDEPAKKTTQAPFAKSRKQLAGIIQKVEAEVNRAPAKPTPPAAGSAPAGAGKAAAEKKGAAKKPEATASNPIWSTHLSISRVEEAKKHPSADRLFVCRINNGAETKPLVTGLVGHYTAEQLHNRLVVTINNLKPAKMKGEESAAMLLAADITGGGVVVLEAPAGSQPGDRVYVEGEESHMLPLDQVPRPLPSKSWEEIVKQLSVHEGHATYGGKRLQTSKGALLVKAPNGSGIH